MKVADFGTTFEKGIGRMWTEKILIVSDDSAMNNMLESTLQNEGVIEVALTEEYALYGIDRDYCAAIVVNDDSRAIDIIDFYGKAVGLYPSIKNRFLFVTFKGVPKHWAFFEKNGLRCIKGLGEVKDAVTKLFSR